MSKTPEQELSIWKTINSTRSVAGLIQACEAIGAVEISGGRGVYDMAERIKQVRGGDSINLLTRNYGIRQQYVYLTEKGGLV